MRGSILEVGISDDFCSLPRIAGGLMLSSVLVLAVRLGLLAVRGRIGGLASAFGGVEDIGEAASAHRTLLPFLTPMAILLLQGFSLFALFLGDLGARAIAYPATGRFIVGVAGMPLEGTFHASLTAWAGERWSETGQVPELCEQLRDWMNGPIQVAFVAFAVAAMALFGWASLETGALPVWVAWLTVGWSVAWLILYATGILGLPIALFALPIVLGIGLASHPRARLRRFGRLSLPMVFLTLDTTARCRE